VPKTTETRCRNGSLLALQAGYPETALHTHKCKWQPCHFCICTLFQFYYMEDGMDLSYLTTSLWNWGIEVL